MVEGVADELDKHGFRTPPIRYKYTCRHFWRDKVHGNATWGGYYILCVPCMNKLCDAMGLRMNVKLT